MTRKKKSLADTSAKVMRRKKPINTDQLLDIQPLTAAQDKVFDDWKKGKNLCLYGCAGTGKTFVALYLALKSVLDDNTPFEKVYIVRSLVATREIGFLPGDHDDKAALYQIPYKNMVQYMFEMPSDPDFDILYDKLKEQETVSFWSTSFIRGTTLDNSIVIVDEMQNLNFHELDSIITRCGQDTKIIFSGDAVQSDLVKTNERNGILNFMSIVQNMEEFGCTEFNIEDIVRSGLVRSYLVAKINAGF
jgi:phosphate starvation-inducible PhoH-like protein